MAMARFVPALALLAATAFALSTRDSSSTDSVFVRVLQSNTTSGNSTSAPNCALVPGSILNRTTNKCECTIDRPMATFGRDGALTNCTGCPTNSRASFPGECACNPGYAATYSSTSNALVSCAWTSAVDCYTQSNISWYDSAAGQCACPSGYSIKYNSTSQRFAGCVPLNCSVPYSQPRGDKCACQWGVQPIYSPSTGLLERCVLQNCSTIPGAALRNTTTNQCQCNATRPIATYNTSGWGQLQQCKSCPNSSYAMGDYCMCFEGYDSKYDPVDYSLVDCTWTPRAECFKLVGAYWNWYEETCTCSSGYTPLYVNGTLQACTFNTLYCPVPNSRDMGGYCACMSGFDAVWGYGSSANSTNSSSSNSGTYALQACVANPNAQCWAIPNAYVGTAGCQCYSGYTAVYDATGKMADCRSNAEGKTCPANAAYNTWANACQCNNGWDPAYATNGTLLSCGWTPAVACYSIPSAYYDYSAAACRCYGGYRATTDSRGTLVDCQWVEPLNCPSIVPGSQYNYTTLDCSCSPGRITLRNATGGLIGCRSTPESDCYDINYNTVYNAATGACTCNIYTDPVYASNNSSAPFNGASANSTSTNSNSSALRLIDCSYVNAPSCWDIDSNAQFDYATRRCGCGYGYNATYNSTGHLVKCNPTPQSRCWSIPYAVFDNTTQVCSCPAGTGFESLYANGTLQSCIPKQTPNNCAAFLPNSYYNDLTGSCTCFPGFVLTQLLNNTNSSNSNTIGAGAASPIAAFACQPINYNASANCSGIPYSTYDAAAGACVCTRGYDMVWTATGGVACSWNSNSTGGVNCTNVVVGSYWNTMTSSCTCPVGAPGLVSYPTGAATQYACTDMPPSNGTCSQIYGSVYSTSVGKCVCPTGTNFQTINANVSVCAPWSNNTGDGGACATSIAGSYYDSLAMQCACPSGSSVQYVGTAMACVFRPAGANVDIQLFATTGMVEMSETTSGAALLRIREGSSVTFRVTLDPAPAFNETVVISFGVPAAAVESRFSINTTSLTFARGVTVGWFTISIRDDSIVNSVPATLPKIFAAINREQTTSALYRAVNGTNEAILQIVDDDSASVMVSRSSVILAEDGPTQVVSFRLSGAPAATGITVGLRPTAGLLLNGASGESRLSFTATNWGVWQNVTVGVDAAVVPTVAVSTPGIVVSVPSPWTLAGGEANTAGTSTVNASAAPVVPVLVRRMSTLQPAIAAPRNATEGTSFTVTMGLNGIPTAAVSVMVYISTTASRLTTLPGAAGVQTNQNGTSVVYAAEVAPRTMDVVLTLGDDAYALSGENVVVCVTMRVSPTENRTNCATVLIVDNDAPLTPRVSMAVASETTATTTTGATWSIGDAVSGFRVREGSMMVLNVVLATGNLGSLMVSVRTDPSTTAGAALTFGTQLVEVPASTTPTTVRLSLRAPRDAVSQAITDLSRTGKLVVTVSAYSTVVGRAAPDTGYAAPISVTLPYVVIDAGVSADEIVAQGRIIISGINSDTLLREGNERGASLNITLTPTPTRAVTIALTTSDKLRASSYTVPFDVGQRSAFITLTAPEDDIDFGTEYVEIVKASVSSTEDPAYTAATPASTTVRVADNDDSGVAARTVISQVSEGSVAREAGFIKLRCKPSALVTVTLRALQGVCAMAPSTVTAMFGAIAWNTSCATLSDCPVGFATCIGPERFDTKVRLGSASGLATSNASLTFTFTPTNYAVEQSFDIAALADRIDEGGRHGVRIVASVASSDDRQFATSLPVSMFVGIEDMDRAGLDLVPTQGEQVIPDLPVINNVVQIVEGGVYRAVLLTASLPVAPVRVTVRATPASWITLPTPSITLERSNFERREGKALMLVVSDDEIATLTGTAANLTISMVSDDPAYNRVMVVPVVIADNDRAGVSVFTRSARGGVLYAAVAAGYERMPASGLASDLQAAAVTKLDLQCDALCASGACPATCLSYAPVAAVNESAAGAFTLQGNGNMGAFVYVSLSSRPASPVMVTLREVSADGVLSGSDIDDACLPALTTAATGIFKAVSPRVAGTVTIQPENWQQVHYMRVTAQYQRKAASSAEVVPLSVTYASEDPAYAVVPGTTLSIAVLSSNMAAPPALVGARMSDDLMRLQVAFSAPFTLSGVSPASNSSATTTATGAYSCSDIFYVRSARRQLAEECATTANAAEIAATATKFGTGAFCTVSTSSSGVSAVTVWLGPDATITPGTDNLVLLHGKVRSTPFSTRFTRGSVALQAPATTVIPRITLAGGVDRMSVGSCDEAVVSVAIGRTGGRDVTIAWSIVSMVNGNGAGVDITQANAYAAQMSAAASLTLPLPPAVLPTSHTAVVSVTVTNFLGNSATAQVTVARKGLPIPVIIMDPTYTATSSRGLSVEARTLTSACESATLPAADREMTFYWYERTTNFRDEGSPLVAGAAATGTPFTEQGVPLVGFTGRTLQLGAGVLRPNTQYQFRVYAVRVKNTASYTSFDFTVEVGPESVSAVIAGGNYRIISSAEAAADLSFSGEGSGLSADVQNALWYVAPTYSWECINPQDESSCGTGSQISMTVSAGTFAAGNKYVVRLTVSTVAGSAQTEQVISVPADALAGQAEKVFVYGSPVITSETAVTDAGRVVYASRPVTVAVTPSASATTAAGIALLQTYRPTYSYTWFVNGVASQQTTQTLILQPSELTMPDAAYQICVTVGAQLSGAQVVFESLSQCTEVRTPSATLIGSVTAMYRQDTSSASITVGFLQNAASLQYAYTRLSELGEAGLLALQSISRRAQRDEVQALLTSLGAPLRMLAQVSAERTFLETSLLPTGEVLVLVFATGTYGSSAWAVASAPVLIPQYSYSMTDANALLDKTIADGDVQTLSATINNVLYQTDLTLSGVSGRRLSDSPTLMSRLLEAAAAALTLARISGNPAMGVSTVLSTLSSISAMRSGLPTGTDASAMLTTCTTLVSEAFTTATLAAGQDRLSTPTVTDALTAFGNCMPTGASTSAAEMGATAYGLLVKVRDSLSAGATSVVNTATGIFAAARAARVANISLGDAAGTTLRSLRDSAAGQLQTVFAFIPSTTVSTRRPDGSAPSLLTSVVEVSMSNVANATTGPEGARDALFALEFPSRMCLPEGLTGAYVATDTGKLSADGVVARCVEERASPTVQLLSVHNTAFTVDDQSSQGTAHLVVFNTLNGALFTSGISLTEAAGQRHSQAMDVKLSVQPSSDVVVNVAVSTGVCYNTLTGLPVLEQDTDIAVACTTSCSGDNTECRQQLLTADVTSLTFTRANYATPQTVTITAAADGVYEPFTQHATVTFTSSSTDERYDTAGVCAARDDTGACIDQVAAAGVELQVSIADGDVPAVLFTAAAIPTSVPEAAAAAGGPYSVTAKLGLRPTAPVTVSYFSTSDALTFAESSSEGRFIFTPDNFDTEQQLSFNIADDQYTNGDRTVAIVYAISSDDAVYEALQLEPLSFTLVDDDVAGVRVSDLSESSISEDGGALTFTVALTSKPLADVAVHIVMTPSHEGAMLTVSAPGYDAASGILTIPAGSGISPITVTVTSVDNRVATGHITVQVQLSFSSLDTAYATVAAVTRSFTQLDAQTAGVVPSLQSGVVVAEGDSVPYSVSLSTAASSYVTVTITVVAPDNLRSLPLPFIVEPATLTFDPGMERVPQAVRLTARNDDIVYPDGAVYTIKHTVTSTDSNYAAASAVSIPVSLHELDIPSLTVVSPAAGTALSLAFTSTSVIRLRLGTMPSSSVTVSVAAGTGITVSPSSLTFSTSNWQTAQTVTVSRAASIPAGTLSSTVRFTASTNYGSDVATTVAVLLPTGAEATPEPVPSLAPSVPAASLTLRLNGVSASAFEDPLVRATVAATLLTSMSDSGATAAYVTKVTDNDANRVVFDAGVGARALSPASVTLEARVVFPSAAALNALTTSIASYPAIFSNQLISNLRAADPSTFAAVSIESVAAADVTVSAPPPTTGDSKGGLSLTAIIGIAVGAGVALIGIIVGAVVYNHYSNKRKREAEAAKLAGAKGGVQSKVLILVDPAAAPRQDWGQVNPMMAARRPGTAGANGAYRG